jgi:hypothetical protein
MSEQNNKNNYKIILNNKSKALVFLTVIPNTKQLDLLAELNLLEMEIIIVCDNNDSNLNPFRELYPSFIFIQVPNDECVKSGYQNLNYMIRKGFPTAWDKAIYILCEYSNYTHMWLIEDDVVIPHKDTILLLDKKVGDDVDLVVKSNFTYIHAKRWHWNQLPKYYIKNNKVYGIDIKTRRFFEGYGSMVCAMRISKNLLNIIKNYANRNKQLFFLEIFFNSLANLHNLKIANPLELTNITWRDKFNIDDINKNYLYHPFKNIDEQIKIRNKFNT